MCVCVFASCLQLISFLSFTPTPQLHNEDDSSETLSSEQPCTSAQAAVSSQERAEALAGPAPSTSAAASAAAVEEGEQRGPLGSWSQGQGEVPPPPYASIDLGAAAAAAPGVCGSSVAVATWPETSLPSFLFQLIFPCCHRNKFPR